MIEVFSWSDQYSAFWYACIHYEGQYIQRHVEKVIKGGACACMSIHLILIACAISYSMHVLHVATESYQLQVLTILHGRIASGICAEGCVCIGEESTCTMVYYT